MAPTIPFSDSYFKTSKNNYTYAKKKKKNDYVNIVSCIPCFGDCNIHLSNCHILGVYHLHNNLSKLPDFDTNYLKI